MPTYYARANGNVNGTIWATTPTGTASNLFSSFTSADTLMANTFTVTLNVNTTVLEIRNDTTGGATAGGTFTLNDGVTLTANVLAPSTGFTPPLQYSGTTSAAIVGNLTGSSGTSNYGFSFNGTGNVSITGNVTGGNANSGDGMRMFGNGTVSITGNVTGGGGNCAGVTFQSGAGTCNITGTVTGGTTINSFGISNPTNSGTFTVTGTCVGGSAGAGASNTGSATMTITRAKGNGFGNGSVGLSSAVGVAAAQTSATRVYEIEYGDLGQSPTSGPIILLNATSNVALFYRTSGGKKTLVDSSLTADYPATGNVRSGTVYGNSNFTGTLAVPSASSVASGVAVDNTTGTAVLTSAAAQSACSSALTAFSSGRLANVATVDSTGAQIAAAVGT